MQLTSNRTRVRARAPPRFCRHDPVRVRALLSVTCVVSAAWQPSFIGKPDCIRLLRCSNFEAHAAKLLEPSICACSRATARLAQRALRLPSHVRASRVSHVRSRTGSRRRSADGAAGARRGDSGRDRDRALERVHQLSQALLPRVRGTAQQHATGQRRRASASVTQRRS